MCPAQIDRVRSFNRVVSRRIGALQTSYLERGRPLGEARLLFEIGAGCDDAGELRSRLGLDSGYLSRLLRALEKQGLVTVAPDASDGRRRRVALTEAGRGEVEAYDDLSDALARSILAPLRAEERERLIAAMAEVERLIRAGSVTYAVEAPSSADARACRDAYFTELNERFEEGFDLALGKASQDDDLMPPEGYFIVARQDGGPVGCGGLRRLGDGVGEVKRMWVAPSVRGIGIAGRLLTELETLAAATGLSVLRLDTNRALTTAQAFYRSRGYREIARYNDNPYANHWFEKRM